MKTEGWSRQKTALLLVSLALTFSITYIIHVSRPYPLHVDEWHHIALAKCTIDSGFVCKTNPYLPGAPRTLNLEQGFHIMLSLLSIVGGLNLVVDYRILPALFACVSALTLFAAVRGKTRVLLAAVFSIVFMASVKSNINILGFIFFTPLALAIPLVYSLFNTIPLAINEAKKEFILASTALFAAIALIHPMSALPLIPATALYTLVKWRTVLANRRFYALCAVAAIVVSAAGSMFLWNSMIRPHYVNARGFTGARESEILGGFIYFKTELEHATIKYRLHELYGMPQTLLALLGLAAALRKKCWFILLWPATMVAWFYYIGVTDVKFLIPYRRATYYTLLSLVPLTAIGAATVAGALERLLAVERFRAGVPKALAFAVATSVLVAILSSSFTDYFKTPSSARTYNIMSDDEYNILKGLKQNHGVDNIVYADRWTSVLVYPVSGNMVVHMVTATLSGREGSDRKMKTFNNKTCEGKREFTRKNRVDFILTEAKTDCGFLKLDDRAGRQYLYAVEE